MANCEQHMLIQEVLWDSFFQKQRRRGRQANDRKEEMKEKEVFQFKIFMFNLKLLLFISTFYISFFPKFKFWFHKASRFLNK
jgi:hypothetical protein